MGAGEARRQQPQIVEVFDEALAVAGIAPAALGCGLEQVGVNAAISVRGFGGGGGGRRKFEEPLLANCLAIRGRMLREQLLVIAVGKSRSGTTNARRMPTAAAARATASASDDNLSTLIEEWTCTTVPTPARARRPKATTVFR